MVLENIEVNDFKLGEIAKFEILVHNAWAETIKDAYSEMVVYSDDGNVLADFKSPTSDVAAGEEALMLAFWDTKGVIEGDYDSTLFLIYEAVRDPTTLTLQVEDDEIIIIGAGFIITGGVTDGGISKNLLYLLIVVIVILVLANISWFFYLRKRFAKK